MHSLSKLALMQLWACMQAFIKVEQANAAMNAATSSSDSPTDLSTLAAGLTVTTSAAQVGMLCIHILSRSTAAYGCSNIRAVLGWLKPVLTAYRQAGQGLVHEAGRATVWLGLFVR